MPSKCNLANTLISIGTKLSKVDNISIVNPTLYIQLVGSLMYLKTIRPHIMYVVNLISKFVESLKDSHWKVEKRTLQYTIGTIQHGILYIAFKEIIYLHT